MRVVALRVNNLPRIRLPLVEQLFVSIQSNSRLYLHTSRTDQVSAEGGRLEDMWYLGVLGVRSRMLSGNLGPDNPFNCLDYAEDVLLNLYRISSNTSPLTSLMLASISFTRCTTGLIDKTSGTSSG